MAARFERESNKDQILKNDSEIFICFVCPWSECSMMRVIALKK
jgi:hypothetical protein